MIKAIVFDCFGVLTTDGWLPFKDKYFGQNKKMLERATKLNQQANAQIISYDDFVANIAAMAGISPAEFRVAIEQTGRIRNEELFEYIKTLKPRYKIGLLSNTSSDMLSQLFNEEQIGLFDKKVLSYEAGVIKPDRQAYQLIADKLGVNPSECVFIDDQDKHCVGARQAGMLAIQYQGMAELKTELDKILASRSDN